MAKLYTDKDYEKYAQALQKAINGQEYAVKQKHIRSAVIGTFQTQTGKIFWAYSLRLPHMENRIVAWKLCHVVHQILREGHPLCLVDSQKHRKDLDELGKLWGHLKEDYGKMIRLYTSLLINKMEFHKINPRFPGDLNVNPDEFESIVGSNVNSLFDITLEIFDYLDHIINLQEAVFGSLNFPRYDSTTSSGQCKLAPLVPCIQDASKLYDYCIKLLYKLHCTLPTDILAGHRERFLKQFRSLKIFYESANNLQYFKDLVTIPSLPKEPPNFQITGYVHEYANVELFLPTAPEQENEPIYEAILIDTTDDSVPEKEISFPKHQEIFQEKEFRMAPYEEMSETNSFTSKNQREISILETKISTLEHYLSLKENELEREKYIKEDLLNRIFLVAQSRHSEQKQFLDEFDKLMAICVKLRNEQHSEISKEAEQRMGLELDNELENFLKGNLEGLSHLHEDDKLFETKTKMMN